VPVSRGVNHNCASAAVRQGTGRILVLSPACCLRAALCVLRCLCASFQLHTGVLRRARAGIRLDERAEHWRRQPKVPSSDAIRPYRANKLGGVRVSGRSGLPGLYLTSSQTRAIHLVPPGSESLHPPLLVICARRCWPQVQSVRAWRQRDPLWFHHFNQVSPSASSASGNAEIGSTEPGSACHSVRPRMRSRWFQRRFPKLKARDWLCAGTRPLRARCPRQTQIAKASADVVLFDLLDQDPQGQTKRPRNSVLCRF